MQVRSGGSPQRQHEIQSTHIDYSGDSTREAGAKETVHIPSGNTDLLSDLKRRLVRSSQGSPQDSGVGSSEQVCELDLEGIVAKHKFGPDVAERENSTWFKILNREYSQKDGREGWSARG